MSSAEVSWCNFADEETITTRRRNAERTTIVMQSTPQMSPGMIDREGRGAMPETVTRKNLGAWVLKCNPEVWDLATFVELGGDTILDWSVAQNYRSDLMRKGDPVVFWVVGPRNGLITYRGLWGVGRLTGTPQWDPSGPLDPANSLWLDKEKEGEHEYGVLTQIPLLHHPIPADVIAAEPVLKDCEIFRVQQIANPSFLTKEEHKALQRIVKTYVPESDEETVTISSDSAGFGDPQQNAHVEEVAMAAVTTHLEKAGFEVRDVSMRKVGWDLTAFRPNGSGLRLVEVKGVSGSQPKVLLTANEVVTATFEDEWELAVVTDALTDPKVAFYSRKAALKSVIPMVWRADLTKAKPRKEKAGKKKP